ncbi:hypothetical protein BCR43DRAFT_498596 [Syncephalastrum racemosum]|uniref:NTF2 domain-containing protein n=1 Tax=Syncephalastrum racemosum TaxID=13706 RepID=A0A1X2H163_SYNRA|nr:hypothetical protein BCR43DRAFT_498596 [Syncephalastrum racemosum]
MTATVSQPIQAVEKVGNGTSPPAVTPAQMASQDVGLLFVREYYTFLNRKPSRLHAFYKDDSVFVRGHEGDPAHTCHGSEEIRQKIQELGFHDAKVLVTQVDSQPSANNGIIIQVVGEMSDAAAPPQKFCQTFFLAPQESGYYVLNDIFRFLKDEVNIDYYSCEEEEAKKQLQNEEDQRAFAKPYHIQTEPEQPPQPEPASTPLAHTVHQDLQPPQVHAPVQSEEIKQSVIEEPASETAVKETEVRETDKEDAKKKDKKKKKEKKEEEPSTQAEGVLANGKPEVEEEKKTKPVQQQHQQQQQQQKPKNTGPTTWANLAASDTNKWGSQVTEAKAAAALSPKPTAATIAPPQSPLPQQQQQQQQQQQVPPPPPPQSAKHQHHQQQHQHQQQQQHYHQRKEESTQIYVKSVAQHMTEDVLREAFSQFGQVKSLNIVHNRNCAFVEFATPSAVARALAQHRVSVGQQFVLAEERRPGGSRHHQYSRQQQQQQQGNRPFDRRFQQQQARAGRGGKASRGGK